MTEKEDIVRVTASLDEMMELRDKAGEMAGLTAWVMNKYIPDPSIMDKMDEDDPELHKYQVAIGLAGICVVVEKMTEQLLAVMSVQKANEQNAWYPTHAGNERLN